MTESPVLAIIVLAAGRSARFGLADKLAGQIGESTVLAESLRAYKNIKAIHRFVIVAAHSTFAETAFAADFDIVVNDKVDAGMGDSIACGMRAVRKADPLPTYVLIGLGDMPCITSTTIATLFSAAKNETDIIVPCRHGTRGHPRLFGAAHFAALAALQGDTGARHLLAGAQAVTEVVVSDAGIIVDVDTTADLERLN